MAADSAEVVVEVLAEEVAVASGVAAAVDEVASAGAEEVAAMEAAAAEEAEASEVDAEADSLHVVIRQWLCVFRIKEFVLCPLLTLTVRNYMEG